MCKLWISTKFGAAFETKNVWQLPEAGLDQNHAVLWTLKSNVTVTTTRDVHVSDQNAANLPIQQYKVSKKMYGIQSIRGVSTS